MTQSTPAGVPANWQPAPGVQIPVHGSRVVSSGEFGALGVKAGRQGIDESAFNALMAQVERARGNGASKVADAAKSAANSAIDEAVMSMLPGLLDGFADAIKQERVRTAQAIRARFATGGGILTYKGAAAIVDQIILEVSAGGPLMGPGRSTSSAADIPPGA